MVLISDGELNPKVLEICNLNERWLKNVLKENDASVENVFLMTCDPTARYYLVKKEAAK